MSYICIERATRTDHQGRGHVRHQSDEVVEVDEPAAAEPSESAPFDLGESENKKVLSEMHMMFIRVSLLCGVYGCVSASV